jgi:phage terminase small subunit
LTPKQESFCVHYVSIGTPTFGNATRAAIAAGYSRRSARSIGSENLTRPDICSAIRNHLNNANINRKRIMQEMAETALTADIADFEDLLTGKKTLRQLRAAGVDTRQIAEARPVRGGRKGKGKLAIRLLDRAAMLDRLAKILGMYGQAEKSLGGGNTAPTQVVNVQVNLEPTHRMIDSPGELLPGLPAPDPYTKADDHAPED